MNEAYRAKIDEISRYRDDLLTFKQALLTPERPADFPELRRSVLQRGGVMQALYERVTGRYVYQPQSSFLGPPLGPPVSIWTLALTPSGYYDYPGKQAKYVGDVVDLLDMFIGQLEAEPTLLDPPPPPMTKSAEGTTQIINIHQGATANVAQTVSGNVSQQTTNPQHVAEIQRLLHDLHEALRQVDAPEEERQVFTRQVAQLEGELAQDRPLVSRLLIGWGAIKAIGTVESGWQGWERAQRIAHELGPKFGDLIEVLTS